MRVTIEYEDPTDGGTAETLAGKPARISSRPESFTEGYAIDADGSLVVNSAQKPFQQPPERQAAVKCYVVKKYVGSSTKAAIKAAWNTNNNASFTIDGDTWEADEGWLADYSFEPVDGSTLWDATVTIKCKRGGWVDRPLNVSFQAADGGDIIIKRGVGPVAAPPSPLPDEMAPTAIPWPLDEYGAPKTGAAPEPDSLLFYPYEQHAWTGVPLS